MTRRLAALALLLCAACHHKSVDEFCDAWFAALEARDVRCDVAAEVAQASWAPVKAYVCQGVLQLEKDGKIVYDAKAGSDCTDRIDKLACGPFFRIPNDPCDLAIVGAVTAGGTCYNGVECDPTTTCAASQCPGTCLPRGNVGDDCNGLAPCVQGAVCVSNKCQAAGTEGQSCRAGTVDCGDGLYCSGEKPIQTTPPGTCKKVAQQTSGACDQTLACAFGTVCAGIDYAANTSGTCQAPVAKGGSCTSSTFCESDAFCAAGKCAARPRLGEACGNVQGGSASCLLGWCQIPSAATSGTCVDFLKTDDPCDSADACGLVARCQGGKCVPLCSAP
jgi:hypothetical protein